MYHNHISLCANDEMLYLSAANFFLDAVQKNPNPHIVLGGGKTPAQVNKKIIERSKGLAVEWQKVHLFLSDERFVSQSSEFSNYRLIYETLVKPLSIPNFFDCICGESLESSIEIYDKALQNSLRNNEVFHLAILGMGEDGHYAGLFPGHEALNADTYAAYGGLGPEGCRRITLTPVFFNQCRQIVLVINSYQKGKAFRRTFTRPKDILKYPLQSIHNKNVVYLMNRQAWDGFSEEE